MSTLEHAPKARVMRIRPRSAQEDTISPGEAARLLGVSPRTLRDWSKKGRICFTLTLGGHRRYRRTDVLLLRAALVPRNGSVAPGTAWELQDLLARVAVRFNAVRQACTLGAARRDAVLIEEDLQRARMIIQELLSSTHRHSAG